MNRELKIYLLTVGLPAVLLTLAGVRLVDLEWRRAMRPPHDGVPMCLVKAYPPPPPRFHSPVDGCLREFGGNLPAVDLPRRPVRIRSFSPLPPPHFVRVFSADYEACGERVLWLGGCLLALLFLTLVSGGWVLVRAVRRSRQEALKQTDFVSNVSHEFKTPLTTICLCAEILQEDCVDDVHRRKALASIAYEAQRLKQLVLNALDFSRLEKQRYVYRLADVAVDEVVSAVCAAFEPRLASGLLSVQVVPCVVRTDADALRQIIANLLDNVCKYAPGKPVEVTMSVQEKMLELTVADRGPGLGSDGLKHAFVRFWRGNASVTADVGGSGLGLSIARGLARGLAGDLTVADRPDGGAIFVLRLPLAARKGA